ASRPGSAPGASRAGRGSAGAASGQARAAALGFGEPVDGWRVWLVVEHEHELRLRSGVFNVVWLPREPLEDEWNRRRMNLLPWRRAVLHHAPLPACDCGIYATTLERTAPYLDPRLDGPRVHRVLGRVSLWGTVVE